jgi:hypothetical protein
MQSGNERRFDPNFAAQILADIAPEQSLQPDVLSQ